MKVIPWWSPEIFSPGGTTLASLVHAARTFDAGIFIFAHDDDVNVQGSTGAVPATRSNVVLEYGSFLSALGPERCMVIKDHTVVLPSDMHGLNTLWIDANSENLDTLLEEKLETVVGLWGRLGPVQRAAGNGEPTLSQQASLGFGTSLDISSQN